MKILKKCWTVQLFMLISGIAQLGWSAALPGQVQGSTNSSANAANSSQSAASLRHAHAATNSAANAANSSRALVSTPSQFADLRSGTKINARLLSTLDVRKAKPGQKVVAKVTKNVKRHGHTIIHKGDKLVGHVTRVQAAAAGHAGSTMAVAFNRLVRGHSVMRLNTVVSSVFSAPSMGQSSPGPMLPAPAPAMAAPAGGGGGGLLGGVGSAAGSTVGSAVGTAGSTVGGVGGTVGAATNSTLGNNSSLGLNTPVRRIHLQSESSVSQSTGMDSVFSTRKGNLHLQSGTRMKFRVAASGRASASQK